MIEVILAYLLAACTVGLAVDVTLTLMWYINLCRLRRQIKRYWEEQKR